MDKLSPTNNGLSDKNYLNKPPCIIMPIHAQVKFLLPHQALANQRDLALAYSPGVAVPCLEIEKDPKKPRFIPLVAT